MPIEKLTKMPNEMTTERLFADGARAPLSAPSHLAVSPVYLGL
jgi:hypothetical protein